jgi:hypothetical protein
MSNLIIGFGVQGKKRLKFLKNKKKTLLLIRLLKKLITKIFII